MDESLITEFEQVQSQIAKINSDIDKQEAKYHEVLRGLMSKHSEIRSMIKAAMEENSVKKFENDFVAISYVAPTTRTSFDSTRFKEEQPDTYKKYLKISDVSSSIRIKIKESK